MSSASSASVAAAHKTLRRIAGDLVRKEPACKETACKEAAGIEVAETELKSGQPGSARAGSGWDRDSQRCVGAPERRNEA